MRGYFGIGVEGISKPMNLGNLLRSAHAFGASFFFTVDAAFDAREVALSDTSDAAQHLPLYTFDAPDEMQLPRACQLIGIEFTEDSVELPSFRHPTAAAYVLGREKGSLSATMTARCDAVVKIPTRFCVNVGTAGAIVMYDRLVSLGRFARRPVSSRGTPEPMPKHVRGGQVIRRSQHTQESGRDAGRVGGEGGDRAPAIDRDSNRGSR
jgi:tRNA(Leu) C34 or U34 (ribose-2'-O)-methylase TrmL